MSQGRLTLTRYTIGEEHRHPGATGAFSGLLNALATAFKIIANQVNKGALVGLGVAGDVRPTGLEALRRLDNIAHDVLIHETEWGGQLAALVSEQLSDLLLVGQPDSRGKYLLLFDAIDGVNNLDLNNSVGTIFSILRYCGDKREPSLADFLQSGVNQVCAGFALYGPATMLVLTTGHGVDGFTLDRDIGAFILTHPQMRIPEDSAEFAINASNERFWEPPIKRYVSECLQGKSGARGKDFNMHWVSSLAAETFRILTRGGVFIDPHDTRAGTGRIHHLYECNPIGFIVEQAGGLASSGRKRLMEIEPGSLHERVPAIFGSRHEVERIVRYHQEHDKGLDSDYRSPLFKTRSLFMNS